MNLKGKTILILAQEPWGKMFLSKHHYALHLAALGNTVYYMNGPDQENILRPGKIRISDTEHAGLKLLEHRLFYPYIIKFQAPALHARLMRIHLKRVLKAIDKPVDLVWSYDLSNTVPLASFPDSIRKIFMPVDEPLQEVAYQAASGADQILSVTQEIIDKYQSRFNIPGRFINHGVSEKFLQDQDGYQPGSPLRVGISGNLLRPELDRATIFRIIEENPGIEFHLWGTVNPADSNLVAVQYANPQTVAFIQDLKALKNIRLHGQVNQDALAKGLKQMDAFLVCYDIKKDQSKGTNYHKVMEFLATGRVIISSNITTYAARPELVTMISDRDSNQALPQLFKGVMNNLEEYNKPELRQVRIAFARQHTYPNQIKKIEQLLAAKPAALASAL